MISIIGNRSPNWNYLQHLTKKQHPLRPGCDTITANRGAYGPPGWAPANSPQGPRSESRSEVLPGSPLEPQVLPVAQNYFCTVPGAFWSCRNSDMRCGTDQRARYSLCTARGRKG